MTERETFGYRDAKISLICPLCGKVFEAPLPVIEVIKEATCPICDHKFRVEK